MKTAITAIRLLLIMTLMTGLIYPLIITGIAKVCFARKAEGSLIIKDNIAVGSELIGQKFSEPKYFWPRPSAVDYNPLPSGGSNLGPTSADLKAAIDKRRLQFQATDGQVREIPIDLLCASASGLDPHISPDAAHYQLDRIMKARGIDQKDKTLLNMLIDKHTEAPSWYLFGEPRVNVLKLNLALDSLLTVQK